MYSYFDFTSSKIRFSENIQENPRDLYVYVFTIFLMEF